MQDPVAVVRTLGSARLADMGIVTAELVIRSLVGRTVADVERDLILETLKHCSGNRTSAAKILDNSIRTLRNKLNEYVAEGVAIPSPYGGDLRGAA